eukprot:gene9303-10284_t
MAEAEKIPSDEIYHERQRLQLCALHAINNLFQDGCVIDKKTMNNICKNLAPDTYMNPHKSILGVGNYDVNAIMVVLDERGSLEEINFENIFGMFVNTLSGWNIFGYLMDKRHWVCVRKINEHYYDLDSKLKQPEKIGDETLLKEFLANKLTQSKTELLFIVEKKVAEERSWEKHQEAILV